MESQVWCQLEPTMLRVERTLVVVRVDSRELDLVARFAHVAEVAEEDGILRAGQAASSNLNASEVDEMMLMNELKTMVTLPGDSCSVILW